MKTTIYLIVAGIPGLAGAFAHRTPDGESLGIAHPGSPHNFADDQGQAELPSSGGWNTREEICAVCHVPHDRPGPATTEPLLWNHGLSSATYTMYSSPSLDGSTAPQPTGFSKLCLGCHDGTVGIDTFDALPGGTVFMQNYDPDFQIPASGSGGANLNLHSTHPISIMYDPVADPSLHPKSAPMGGSGSIEDVLEGGDTVQCSTCHDVHDQPGESVPGTPLLRVGQKASTGQPSGLCLSCHIK